MLPDEPTMVRPDPALLLRRESIVDAMHVLVHEPNVWVAVRRLRVYRPRHPSILSVAAMGSATLALLAASASSLVLPAFSANFAGWLAAMQAGGPPLPAALAVVGVAVAVVCAACLAWAGAVGAEAPLLPSERVDHLDLSRRLLEMDREHALVFPPMLVTPEPASPRDLLHDEQSARWTLLG
ncbi:MAG: hypothetical protein ACI8PZ_004565 [Myxococcota bacterium]|jgi:hypothetical protein